MPEWRVGWRINSAQVFGGLKLQSSTVYISHGHRVGLCCQSLCENGEQLQHASTVCGLHWTVNSLMVTFSPAGCSRPLNTHEYCDQAQPQGHSIGLNAGDTFFHVVNYGCVNCKMSVVCCGRCLSQVSKKGTIMNKL